MSAISEQVDEEVNEKLERSPVVTVLTDESTDIANRRMMMHARIVDPKTSVPETVYIRDIEYEDGRGEGLTKEIVKETSERKILPANMFGFGSDGAMVMSGDHKDVKGRLKKLNTHIVHVHCMAHRLNQSSGKQPFKPEEVSRVADVALLFSESLFRKKKGASPSSRGAQ